MSIGSDKSESAKMTNDPLIEAQRDLVANPAINPQELLLEQNDPVRQQPVDPSASERPIPPKSRKK